MLFGASYLNKTHFASAAPKVPFLLVFFSIPVFRTRTRVPHSLLKSKTLQWPLQNWRLKLLWKLTNLLIQTFCIPWTIRMWSHSPDYPEWSYKGVWLQPMRDYGQSPTISPRRCSLAAVARAVQPWKTAKTLIITYEVVLNFTLLVQQIHKLG